MQITRLLYIKHVVSFSKKTHVFEHICDQNPPKKAPLNVLTDFLWQEKINVVSRKTERDS